MGGKFSKNKEVDTSSIEDSNPRYQSHLNSYEAACRADPSLQDFDKTLHNQADRVIRTLAGGAEAQSLALNSLGVVTNGLLEMNHELAKIILASREDIWNDKELSRLVEYYFKHGLEILDFYTSLENCLRRARDSQLRIQLALMHFEEERGENVGGEKYVKTLQDLQKFKEAGDPFTDEFSKLFHSVNQHQREMLKELQARKNKFDKNVKSAQTRRRVTNAIFVTAFVSTLIFSVVAVAIAAPPVVIALAAAMAAPIGTVGKWCDTWWKNYRKQLKVKKELTDLMYAGTKISIYDLETIRSLVSKLEIEIESILQNADFALGEEQEEAVKLGMLEIKKRVEVFKKTMEDLSVQADKSSREIRMARTVILQRIIGQSSR
ncbi:hypothetical protein BT93_H1135 [Corymbia citriodora subsp. variegata]|nr:hypothetical protein BT93_H1135 [Corymbia citriodora subsp. variegata]